MRLSSMSDTGALNVLLKEAEAALKLQLVKGELRGRYGWHTINCTNDYLIKLLDAAKLKEDWGAVACYANMLYVRELGGIEL